MTKTRVHAYLKSNFFPGASTPDPHKRGGQGRGGREGKGRGKGREGDGDASAFQFSNVGMSETVPPFVTQ
jgi:hypothetical protein